MNPKVMKTITAYTSGFKAAISSVRMVILIYLSILAIALLLAIPFYPLFNQAAGHSMLPRLLMQGFDATVIRELLAGGGKLFLFYFQAFWPWVIALFLFQIFLNGGIYSRISNPRGKFSLTGFVANARRYFWRFLKLAVYMLIVHLFITLVLWVPWMLIMAGRTGLTDAQVLQPVIVTGAIHLAIIIFLMTVSDLARSIVYEQDTGRVFRTVRRAFGKGFRQIVSFYPLALLLVMVPVLSATGYYFIRISARVDTFGMIFLLFIFQQAFILLRVFFRVWRLSAVYGYYLKPTLPI
jgi:hypothetical protein